MIEEEILKDLQESDLPDNFMIVADNCGIEVVRKLILELGGLQFCIPKLTSIKPLIKRYIAQNPEKNNQRLARELSLNVRTIDNIID